MIKIARKKNQFRVFLLIISLLPSFLFSAMKMSLKFITLALGVIAFVQAQEGKLETGSLDKLIDGALSRDNDAAADDIPKVNKSYFFNLTKFNNFRIFIALCFTKRVGRRVCSLLFVQGWENQQRWIWPFRYDFKLIVKTTLFKNYFKKYLDIRFNEESPCVDYFEQCCETGEILPPTHTTPPPNPILRSATCGYRNVEGVGFRITGNNDNEAEYGVRNYIFIVSTLCLFYLLIFRNSPGWWVTHVLIYILNYFYFPHEIRWQFLKVNELIPSF